MSRNLYLMRGVPASGKTEWLSSQYLLDLTISIDELRKLKAQPLISELHEDGSPSMRQLPFSIEGSVWKLAEQLVEDRMLRGDTTFIDATHLFKGQSGRKAYKRWETLARKYGYRVSVITVGENLTLRTLINRDLSRSNSDYVGKDVIKKYYNRLHNLEEDDEGNPESYTIPNRIKQYHVYVSTDENGVTKGYDSDVDFDWHVKNIDSDKQVIVIGDVHNSISALEELFKEQGYPKDNPDTTYVFVGDYLDRGENPVKTFKMMQKLQKLPNVVTLIGNHDRRFLKFSLGMDNSRIMGTVKPLLESRITKEEIFDFFNHLQALYIFSISDEKFIVSHAGFTHYQDVKNRQMLLAEEDYLFNAGGYDIDVDKTFYDSLHYGEDYWVTQIHGHRNGTYNPVIGENSINLEQGVEFGGELGSVKILGGEEGADVINISVKNPYHPADTIPRDKDSLPYSYQWQLQHHSGITEKKLDNGLSSYNFTSKVFRKGNWDKLTLTARGLFMDKTQHIQVRGFNKFFALSELDKNSIIDKVNGSKTIDIYEKENGFLALASWIPQEDDYRVYSKGGTGPYTEFAEKFVKGNLGEDAKVWFKEHTNVTVLFEVVDPIEDPHIIYKDEYYLSVLDVLENIPQEKSRKDLLDDFCGTFTECSINQEVGRVISSDTTNIGELQHSLKCHIDDDFNNHAYITDSEGYVVTLDRGLETEYKFKVKFPYYLALKEVRNKLVLDKHGNIDEYKTKERLENGKFYHRGSKQLLKYLITRNKTVPLTGENNIPNIPLVAHKTGLEKYWKNFIVPRYFDI